MTEYRSFSTCETSQALIRYNRTDDSFYIYTEKKRLQACDLQSAQNLARRMVKQLSLEKAERAGGMELEVSLKEKLLANMNQEFLEWRIVAKAVGYPQSSESICSDIKYSPRK
ncbi:MAG: hypothetical protein ACOYIE_00665 [Agathobaculum sp.]|jgi:hypothetical protein|uniref:hypothetical protein n=1 Tax=Agathobaculum sp. TaxID=2048138 RepID=UPI003D93959A